MEMEEKIEYPTVLFKLANTLYGLTAQVVASFVQLEQVHELPGAPDYIRGILNLRGSIVALTDLRALLGMQTMNQQTQQTQEMLEQRKLDHVNWLNELERSVLENREFRLTTDPHACAFGKWYDSYHTDDNRLRFLLNKFAEPHARIHAVAAQIQALLKDGQYDQARGVIDHTREHELRQMLDLFSSLSQEIAEGIREIVMISDCGDVPTGFVIDEIAAIEHLKEAQQTAFSDSGRYTIGKRTKDDAPVIVLDPDWLLRQACASLA